MSHVDDGILHAYLDGALDALSAAGELQDGASAADVMLHLSACADCRARLEAERAIRDGAGSVMNDAALPHVAVPPLAGIAGARPREPQEPVAAPLPPQAATPQASTPQAATPQAATPQAATPQAATPQAATPQAVTPQARTRPARGRWVPLSWAATVVLAVGAGWWASAVWRGQGMDGIASEQAVSGARGTPEAAATDPGENLALPSPFVAEAAPSAHGDPAFDSEASPGPTRDQLAARALRSADAGDARTDGTPADAPSTDLPAGIAAESRQAVAPPTDLRASIAAGSRAADAPAAPRQPAAAVREPIGVSVNDRQAAGLVAQRADTLAETARGLQDLRARAAASSPARAFQSGSITTGAVAAPPPVITTSAAPIGEPLGDAAQKQVLVRPFAITSFVGLPAFADIDARERSGSIVFAAASPADLAAVAPQTFIVANASPPAVEVAREIGVTIVRVRQTLPSGERIELISWRETAIMLESLVVTGQPEQTQRAEPAPRSERGDAPQRGDRRAREEAADASASEGAPVELVRVLDVRTLGDGRRELLLRGTAPAIWIAVRAYMDADALVALTSQLTQPSRR